MLLLIKLNLFYKNKLFPNVFFKVIEKKGSITPIFKNLLKNFFLCTTVPIACWLQSHASRGLKPDVPDAGGGLGVNYKNFNG